MFTVAKVLMCRRYTHNAYTVIHMLYSYVYNNYLGQYFESKGMKSLIQIDCLLCNYTPGGIINYGTSNLLDITIQMYIGLYCFSYITIVFSVHKIDCACIKPVLIHVHMYS